MSREADEDFWDVMQRASRDIVLKVAEGNPGAVNLCAKLTHYERWFELMKYLAENGPRGPKLWELYKDVFKQDFLAFGDELIFRMRAHKNECLPTASLQVVEYEKRTGRKL